MKIKDAIYIILISGSLISFPFATTLGQGSSGGTFDINSQTLIMDTDGNYIDFKTFIGLNPGTDYGELMPEFEENGSLKLIKINLKRPLKTVKSTEDKPNPQVVVQSSTATQSEPTVQSASKHTTSPKEEEKTEKKKFRFTTASELQGQYAPYFSEKDVNGREYSTNSLHGKIIVVKFWFLKCGPCLEEIPELNRLVDRYKNESDVQFIAPATDDFDAVRRFMSKKSFRYTILPDSYDIHGDFKVAGYPTHLIIYRNGNVGKVLTGKNSKLYDVLSKAIDEGLLLESDDSSITEIPQPLYTTDKTFIAEEGTPLSKEEYLNKLTTGNYRVYRRIKIDGREEIFLDKIFE